MHNSAESIAEADDPATLIAPSRRYQLAISDLALGMFVAELDRPWLDTPFLLQGFLVDSQVELDTLRKCCSYVYVDLELSLPEVAETIRRAEVRGGRGDAADGGRERRESLLAALGLPPDAAHEEIEITDGSTPTRPGQAPAGPPGAGGFGGGTGTAGSTGSGGPAGATGTAGDPARSIVKAGRGDRVFRARSDVKISSDTRQRFREMVRVASGRQPAPPPPDGIVERMLGRLRSLFGPDREAPRASRDAVRAHLPADMPTAEYPEVRTVADELPRARSSFSKGETVLRTVVSDIKQGKIPQLAQVEGAVGDMVDSLVDNPDALMWVARLREEDVTTYNHGVKVALYMIAIGRHLGMPKKELTHLGTIGLLADVGKIKLPRALLEKPGMLSQSEFGLIKEHVRLGLEALAMGGEVPAQVRLGIEQHHERLDGTGYPNGLKGDQISIYGRMAAIADCFAALITPRVYANPVAPQDALMNLFEWAGSSFHEPLVEQFVQAVGVFPVGSLVELSSGEVAVVVAHNRVRRLEPKVLVLTGPDKIPLPEPVESDLLARRRSAGGKPVRIVRGLPAGAYGLKLRDYYAREIAKSNGLPA